MTSPNLPSLESIAILAEELEKKGLYPVLVGGMALIALGSQRVTKDIDFLISTEEKLLDDLVGVLYAHGFELVSKFNKLREVERTIDNKKVASLRLKMDAPTTAFFFNHQTRLKTDLLFDFPFPAKEIAANATLIKIGKRTIRTASPQDLIRLKEAAYKDRGLSTDAQDLEFLRKLNK
jgi:hypothetical protein